jgi:probable HAF family extracellular repeat protein
MVGSYQNQVGGAVHGWLYNGSGFSTLDVLGTGLDTFARGINDTGQIVGFTQNQVNFQHHGFLFNGSTISTFDVPFAGVTSTEAFGINNDGQIVGNYSQNGTTFGFIKTGNAFTSFNAADFVPGAIFTQLSDINNNGDLVGFFIDSNLVAHGFFYDGVQFVTLDVSGATQTIANGINDQDMIVGQFLGGTNTHGFLAVDPPGSPNAVVVPLPSTLLLLSSGLLGLGVLRRRWSLKS